MSTRLLKMHSMKAWTEHKQWLEFLCLLHLRQNRSRNHHGKKTKTKKTEREFNKMMLLDKSEHVWLLEIFSDSPLWSVMFFLGLSKMFESSGWRMGNYWKSWLVCCLQAAPIRRGRLWKELSTTLHQKSKILKAYQPLKKISLWLPNLDFFNG